MITQDPGRPDSSVPSVHVQATPQLTVHALGACAVPRKLRDSPPGTKVWLLRPAPFWVRHVASAYGCGWQHLQLPAVAWERSQGWPKALGSCPCVGDLKAGLDSWLWISLVPAIAISWGMNHQMEDLPLCRSDFPMKLKTNLKKKKKREHILD